MTIKKNCIFAVATIIGTDCDARVSARNYTDISNCHISDTYFFRPAETTIHEDKFHLRDYRHVGREPSVSIRPQRPAERGGIHGGP